MNCAISAFKYWTHKRHKKLFVFNAETFTKFMLSNESKKYYKNVQDFLITLKLPFMNLNVKER